LYDEIERERERERERDLQKRKCERGSEHYGFASKPISLSLSLSLEQTQSFSSNLKMRPLNHIHDASFRDKLLASKPISESGQKNLLSWIVCLARTDASQARSNQFCIQKCMMKNFKRA
jgi:hypothetical protein